MLEIALWVDAIVGVRMSIVPVTAAEAMSSCDLKVMVVAVVEVMVCSPSKPDPTPDIAITFPLL